MILGATVEPQSIRFFLDNDVDAAALMSAIASSNSLYPDHTILFTAPVFPPQPSHRRFNIEYQSTARTGGNNAIVTLGIPANDINGEFFYEDLRQIIERSPLLSGTEEGEMVLRQGREALRASMTIFIPNQKNPRFAVELQGADCRLTFNLHHSDYDPLRATQCTNQIGNKFGPDNSTPKANGFRMNYANIDEMGPLNYSNVTDIRRLSFLTMRLMEYDFLTPSESADFIQNVRAQRVSLLAGDMLRTAKSLAHSRGTATDKLAHIFEEVFTRIAQDRGFHTLSLDQLQMLADIGAGGMQSRAALSKLLPDDIQNPLLLDEIPAMMRNYRQEIIAQQRALFGSSEPAAALHAAGVTISESPRADPDLSELIRKLERSAESAKRHMRNHKDMPHAKS